MRTYDKAWFDAATPDLAKGLRGGIATLVPFYLAARLGRHEFAWMAFGGWLGTLIDPGGLRSTRAKTLSAFALFGGAALVLAERASDPVWLATLLLVLVAFVASLVRSLGAVWASGGTMIAIVVAVGSSQASSASLRDGCYFAAGAGFAALISSVIWPIWTHLPLRRAEASVFEALARYAEAIESCIRDRAPEGDARWGQISRHHHRLIRNAVEEARRLALGGRARRAGETRLGANLRVVLGLAEAQFPLLITLKETCEVESDDAHRQVLLSKLRAFSRRDSQIAALLRTPNLHARESRAARPPPESAGGPRSSIAALLEHLDDSSRAALELAASLDAHAEPALARRKACFPTFADLSTRLRGDLATLRDAASARSTFFHHGLRVAGTVGVASLVAQRVSAHPQWVTVTALAVLQPYSGATAARAAQRVLGTVLGSIAAALINMMIQSPALLSAVMFPLSVAAVATHRRNYRMFTFFLTPVFVLLAERFQGDWLTAAERAVDALIGGAIAFVAAVFVFPSRERTRLPELLARMLEALSSYAAAVFSGRSERHLEAVESRIVAMRREAGIALSEAENSLERLLAEFKHDMAVEEYALQLITYGRRAASALTTLDTYLARGLTPANAIEPGCARAVESYLFTTLHEAAAVARGAAAGPEAAMPNLPSELDLRLRSTLARLLRGAKLIAEISHTTLALTATGAPARTRHSPNAA